MISFNKLDLFDDESDDDGSGSGSPGKCDFPFCSDESDGSVGESIGRVRGVGSGILVLTGMKSIGDVVLLFVFLPIGFQFKDVRLIEIFFCSKY